MSGVSVARPLAYAKLTYAVLCGRAQSLPLLAVARVYVTWTQEFDP